MHDALVCKGGYILTSEAYTRDLDEFCEDAPHKLVATVPGAAGWGIAVEFNSTTAAVGVDGSTISIYTALPSIATVSSTLLLSGRDRHDNAYGICWDDQGGLYATNFPSNKIDHWTAAGVAVGGLPDGGTLTTTNITEDYFLACDFDSDDPGPRGYLMADGFNWNSQNVDNDVARVTLPNGPDTIVETFGGLDPLSPPATGFPGGMAIKRDDTLEVNSQVGGLINVGNKEPWTPGLAFHTSCTYLNPPNDVTGIAYDGDQLELWGANIHIGPGNVATTYAKSFMPSPPSGPCAVGESGGPTPTIPGELLYMGLGVYPNKGN